MKRAVIYARQSSKKGEDRTRQAVQIKECEDYAREQGWEVVDTVSVDESAATFGPGFQKVVEMGRAKAFDVFLCNHSDRFTRNESEFDSMGMIGQIVRLGVSIATIDLGESASPDNWYFAIKAARAERKSILHRTMTKKAAKVEGGQYLPTPTVAYGWQYSKATGLTLAPNEADVVRRIFRLYVDGVSTFDICKALNADGIPTKGRWSRKVKKAAKGKFEWQRATVVRILGREAYVTGIWKYNTPRWDRQGPHGEAFAREVTVPTIIDLETWDKAVLRREENKRLAKRAHKRTYALSGLCVCSLCGRRLTGSVSWGTRFYRCTDRSCKLKQANADALEGAVWDFLTGLATDVKKLEASLQEWSDRQISNSADGPARLEAAEAELAECDNEEGVMLDGLKVGFSQGLVASRLKALAERRLLASRRVAEAQAMAVTPPTKAEIHQLALAYRDFHKDWLMKDATPEEMKIAIHAIDPGALTILVREDGRCNIGLHMTEPAVVEPSSRR